MKQKFESCPAYIRVSGCVRQRMCALMYRMERWGGESEREREMADSLHCLGKEQQQLYMFNSPLSPPPNPAPSSISNSSTPNLSLAPVIIP